MRVLLSLASRPSSRQWICSLCRQKQKGARSYSTPSKPLNITTAEGLKAQGPLRTRFAPSPTGYLHLGSLRTALFNYLVAKATGGQFILRIEDTDQKRTVSDAEKRLFEDLEWAGIEWDEGPKVGGPYGPYKQSERLALYTEHAEKLIESGNAYRCFCTPERLNSLAQIRNLDNQYSSYDRACHRKYSTEEATELAAQGVPHVIRLKVPSKYPLVKDLVYGNALMRTRGRFYPEQGAPSGFEDPILMKSDGFPTYHLANVVDDHLMKITHVIRGAEWMSSTPKHFALYQAFGWEPPQFAHVGLLLDASRAKLSKRNQDIDIASYRKQGVFPETLTNFVALLGWSHTQKKDLMSMQDLIENASMKYTRGDSVVSFEKLWFLQKGHAERYASLPPATNPSHSLLELAVEPIFQSLLQAPTEGFEIFHTLPGHEDKRIFITKILLVDAAKYKTPGDFIERNMYFFRAPKTKEIKETLVPLEIHIRSTRKEIPSQSFSIPVLNFLPLLSQLTQIPSTSWNSTELKEVIDSMSLQAALSTHLPASSPHHSDSNDRTTPDKSLQKAWGKLIHEFIRWALLARYSGPDSAQSMVILGRAECLRRLNRAGRILYTSAKKGKENAENQDIAVATMDSYETTDGEMYDREESNDADADSQADSD